MSDPSPAAVDLREQLLELDRRLRSIQQKLGPEQETTPPLQVPPLPGAAGGEYAGNGQPAGGHPRTGPLSDLLEKSRLQQPLPTGHTREDLAAELKELAELHRLLSSTTQGLGALLEQYRGALEQALRRAQS